MPDVLTGLHTSPAGGHMGVKKTLADHVSTGPGVWSSGVVADNCVIPGNHLSKLVLQCSLEVMPLKCIAMDIVGPFLETRRGNRYILVIGDYFTK